MRLLFGACRSTVTVVVLVVVVQLLLVRFPVALAFAFATTKGGRSALRPGDITVSRSAFFRPVLSTSSSSSSSGNHRVTRKQSLLVRKFASQDDTSHGKDNKSD